MQVNFAPLNADWGLAHLVINSVCFAFSVILTLYAAPYRRIFLCASCPHKACHFNAFHMYWMWCFHYPGEGLVGAFQRMLPEQKCITFALAALIFLNQPQSVFYRNSLYNYEGQVAELVLYCFSISAFLTFWLVIIDVMSKQNPVFATFRKGFWIYKSMFLVCFFAAHFYRLYVVLGYARKETGAQNSQSNPDFFEKLGGYPFVSFIFSAFAICLDSRPCFHSFFSVSWLWFGPCGGSRASASAAAISSRCPTFQLGTVRLRTFCPPFSDSCLMHRLLAKQHLLHVFSAFVLLFCVAQPMAGPVHVHVECLRPLSASIEIHLRVVSRLQRFFPNGLLFIYPSFSLSSSPRRCSLP
jgi:hypothetical protein